MVSHKKYHAHVYFDAATLEQAEAICTLAGERFDVVVGSVHRKPVGPHPHWSCQLAFDDTQMSTLIPWLDAHRADLTVLIHELTGDDLKDHTEHVSWLGDAVALKLSVFDAS